MKVAKNKPASPNTTVIPNGFGTVRITHTQGVKQSQSYQTADCSYTVEIVTHDDEKSVQKGIKRVERIVEDALGAKLPEVCQLLETLVKKNT